MCGIFGAVSYKPEPQLPEWVFFGLSQLQHRGQESAGVAYSDGNSVQVDKGEGLVSHVLTGTKINEIASHNPTMMIGQTRYSTSKGTSSRNIQPQYRDPITGKIALVHNGNIPNLEEKKEELRKLDQQIDISPQANDTEFMLTKILFLMTKNGGDIDEAIKEFMGTTNGSYSAALLTKNAVYVFRDPWGNRPLFISSKDGVMLFASETCALEDYSEKIIEIPPGRRVKITPIDDYRYSFVDVEGFQAVPVHASKAHCVFEKIYFARPDSQTFGKEEEGKFRFRLGQKLAKLFPVPTADFISGIPESGLPAAKGFAFESHLPSMDIYARNPYILGRTFINPNPGDRASYSKKKYHLMKWVLDYAKNKSIVLIDDSIVRGNTMKGKVAQLFKAGAREVHLRISSPSIISECFYGIDLPTREELIAFNKSEEEVRAWLGATSLKYLPVESLRDVLEEGEEKASSFCQGCFTGEYPIPLL
ncbi:MAG: amidophosphoribosyltransferase [bacterium]|nr:amidophosphoribosyltransferase [bacterium]